MTSLLVRLVSHNNTLQSQVVRPHDEGCEQIQRRGDDTTSNATTHNATATTTNDVENPAATTNTIHPPGGMKHAESYDTGEITAAISDSFCLFDNTLQEEDDRDCPICMEPFAVGDIVSWSSYEKCSHVYHHQCIKEWLLRHNNCPFCREIFLPVDRANTKITMKVFRELSDLRAKRAEKTYYCVQDGLVTLEDKHCKSTTPPTGTATATTATTATTTTPILRKCGHIKSAKTVLEIKEKLKPGVTKAELKKLRGDRAEKICMGDTENNLLDIMADPDLDIDEDIEARPEDVEEHAVQVDPGLPEEATTDRKDSLTIESSDEEDDALEENASICDETDSVVEAGLTAGGFQCATGLVLEEAFASIGGRTTEQEINTQTVEENGLEATALATVLVCEKRKEEAAAEDEESQMDAPIEWELNESDATPSIPTGGADDIESQVGDTSEVELKDSEDSPKVEGDVEDQMNAAIEIELNKSDESVSEKSANDETAGITLTVTDEDLSSEASF
jgi:Ring finger domain